MFRKILYIVVVISLLRVAPVSADVVWDFENGLILTQ